MTIYSSGDYQNECSDVVVLHIQRIEVFMIPALAIDANGYRVCLRISSNRGYGWSEIFIDETDYNFVLPEWEQLLSTFIGASTVEQLSKSINEYVKHNIASDQRAVYLFTNALHQLTFLPDKPQQHEANEELILRNRATSYICLS